MTNARELIPEAASVILAFVRKTETGREGGSAYTTIYGHNENKLGKPLTAMTINEVIEAGPGWTKRYGSSAAGAYQVMRDTLKGLVHELGLTGKEVMSPELQDRMGLVLLQRRGYEKFITKQIGAVAFAKALAQEWASFPVLAATQGAHRRIARGQSYYAGDGKNAALVQPNEIEAMLAVALAAAGKPVQRQDAPAGTSAAPDRPSLASAILSVLAAIFNAISAAFRKR